MPDAAAQKDNHDIEVSAQLPFSVSAQRNIEVAGKKTGQGDMPFVPELRDIRSLIGGKEVDGNLDTEHKAKAARHVAVAAKVQIYLERIEYDNKKGIQTIQRHIILEAPSGGNAEGIGKQNLFTQPQHKQAKPHVKIFIIKMFAGNILKLGQHFLMADNGTGNQLRKKGNKERVVRNSLPGNGAMSRICQKSNLLKGKKANAERKKDARKGKARVKKLINIFQKKIKVFEVKKNAKVSQYAACKNSLFMRCFQ